MQRISRIFLCCCAGLILAVAAADNASAALVAGDQVQVTFGGLGQNIPEGWSGQIHIDIQSGTSAGIGFDTFCLDSYKGLVPAGYNGADGIYYVATDPASDLRPITDEVKWLFANYAMNQLDDQYHLGSLFSYNDAASANFLQQAIWHSENIAAGVVDNFSISTEALKIYAAAQTAVAGGNTDVVYPLRLFSLTQPEQGPSDTQNLLFIPGVDDILPQNPTPEPATLTIWGLLAMVGVGARLRRRNSAK